MDIGSKIKELRIKKGLTQSELAKECNLSKNAIWNYENGKRNPKIEVVSLIATALNVSLSTLIETQETLTNKIIKFIDATIYKNMDALNTLELVSELIDLDFDALSNALKYNEDISESYLIALLKLLYDNNEKLFYNFYEENKELIFEKYWICNNYCNELMRKVDIEKKFINIASPEENKIYSIGYELESTRITEEICYLWSFRDLLKNLIESSMFVNEFSLNANSLSKKQKVELINDIYNFVKFSCINITESK